MVEITLEKMGVFNAQMCKIIFAYINAERRNFTRNNKYIASK